MVCLFKKKNWTKRALRRLAPFRIIIILLLIIIILIIEVIFAALYLTNGMGGGEGQGLLNKIYKTLKIKINKNKPI